MFDVEFSRNPEPGTLEPSALTAHQRPVRVLLSAAAAVGLALASAGCGRGPAVDPAAVYTGSGECRPCHEDFYRKWSTSHHGLAMQPFTETLARAELRAHTNELAIAGRNYRFLVERGVVRETGPNGAVRDYPVVHVMGGKNVYYFLTPLDRGVLQVLPLAYDVRRADWYDTAASAVRHFPGHNDQPLEWTDRLYTFNTSCFDCHVSQLATRYDPTKDAYATTWKEPGINCETCHGPGSEHARLFRAAPSNAPPRELHLLSTKKMTPAQRNDMCAPCHAKMSPLTLAFQPGGRYFDHFDLVTLENEDFHPDGRDLGENYTMTSWRMNACARADPTFDCVHCHTSSGRNRFTGAEANHACLPCHEARVKNAPAHTHHPAGAPGNRCVACHMPTTEFARMLRSDHSMRPPMPAAAARFGSALACLNCHTNRNAAWAELRVREWHPGDEYQTNTLHWAGLVQAAKRGDWSRLPATYEYLSRTNREEIVAVSLARMLAGCPDESKWGPLERLMDDPSPLVRAGAAESLARRFDGPGLAALTKGVRDDYRLVRVRSAMALGGWPRDRLPEADRAAFDRASAELETFLNLRADDAMGHYNRGNHRMACGDVTNATAAFETSLRLRPDLVPPMVNLAFAYNAQGRNAEAERHLRKACEQAPSNGVVRLNLALLLGEMGRPDDARRAWQQVLALEPTNAVAAYNLGVMAGATDPEEAVRWCRSAAQWAPAEPKYAYTYAFYLAAAGRAVRAEDVLAELVRSHPTEDAAWSLLIELQARAGRRADALETCRRALAVPGLPPPAKRQLEEMRRALDEAAGTGNPKS